MQEYKNNTNFRNAWNLVYNSIQAVDALVAIPHLIRSLPEFYQAVRNSKYALGAKRLVKDEFWRFLRNGDVNQAGNLLDELTVAVKNSCNADELAELVQDAASFNLAKTQPQQFINGKNFERGIGNLIDNGDQAFLNQITNHSNVNLSQFTSIKQLQINLPNGGYMIADNAWVKQINVGGQVQFEVVLNECKLSSAAPWTTRQTELINSLNGGNITFTTRSAKAEITSIIPQNSTIKIKSLIKTEGAGSGHVVTKVF